MTTWRMSFHVGIGGYDMFPTCLRLGVAAITYDPLARIDLTSYSDTKKPTSWSQLGPNQKSSLAHLAFHMRGGDEIYVKDHQNIINRGTILGEPDERAYKYDPTFSIVDPNGTPWAHQVSVDWHSDFEPKRLLLNAELTTVLKLNEQRIQLLRNELLPIRSKASKRKALQEKGYHRETPSSLKYIQCLHTVLSNEFCSWLESHGLDPRQEFRNMDVDFRSGNNHIVAELKTCFGSSSRHAIREALGQILEYNYYPKRKRFDTWLIVLDYKPTNDDRDYISLLRSSLGFPLYIGWRSSKERFNFHPDWSPALHA